MHSVSFFKSLFSELVASRVVLVPSDEVANFCIYCKILGVYPCGGALIVDGGKRSQYLYL